MKVWSGLGAAGIPPDAEPNGHEKSVNQSGKLVSLTCLPYSTTGNHSPKHRSDELLETSSIDNQKLRKILKTYICSVSSGIALK